LLVVEIAQNLFSTRRGSLLIGGAAAVLAGLVLLVYLHNYRNSIQTSTATGPVLIAKNLIPKGTSGDIIASSQQYQVASLPKSEFKTGAITDPGTLTGRVALTDIYPRQQLSAADFSATPLDTLGNHITGGERAISVSMDATHGMVGQIGNNDHIDIYVGLNRLGPSGSQAVIKLLMADVTVLRAPLAGGSGIFTLKATTRQAAVLAYAADNGRLWFVLRPPSGAKTEIPGYVSMQSLLLGLKPVR
jgi:Flp pilus assembly protein CpaB